MELSELIYQVVNDEALRSLMKADIKKAVASVGADLSREELEALAAVSWDMSPSTRVLQGPDQWWVSQLNRCSTPVRPSMPA